MERICFVLHVKSSRLAEYKERHKRVWPEMLASLREAGWCNYSLFLRPDGMLIGYLETSSFSRALALMKESDINERWQREMSPFFESRSPKMRADDQMAPLEEVFHLD